MSPPKEVRHAERRLEHKEELQHKKGSTPDKCPFPNDQVPGFSHQGFLAPKELIWKVYFADNIVHSLDTRRRDLRNISFLLLCSSLLLICPPFPHPPETGCVPSKTGASNPSNLSAYESFWEPIAGWNSTFRRSNTSDCARCRSEEINEDLSECSILTSLGNRGILAWIPS